jgi:hypothetical protein
LLTTPGRQQAPEYVPTYWIGPHVGKRLAEALRTLRHLPINGCPAGFTNSWPEYAIEWTDRLAQLEGDQEQQEQEAKARNWTRIVPSSVEISRMETAIVWPARYLGYVPQLLRTVQAWRSRALRIVTWCMRRACSGFRVGSRADGIARASISLPPGCGAMRWRCSEKRWLYLLIRRERRKPGAGSIP